MALNELLTNAVKYGALCTDVGRISVVWRLEQDAEPPTLTLEWREEGGPPVRPPARRGVGSRLMELCIERDLGGQLELAFNPEGVACDLSVPLERVEE